KLVTGVQTCALPICVWCFASPPSEMKLDARIPGGPLAQKWDKHRFEMKLVNPANKRKFDVIVVGSGLAGAAAAASLAELGYNVRSEERRVGKEWRAR